MSESIAFVRYSQGQSLQYVATSPLPLSILVFDACGEVEPPLLRDRLAQFWIPFRPQLIALRGLSEFLRDDIYSGSGRRILADAFGGEARILELAFGPAPFLRTITEGALAAPNLGEDEIISLSADVELHAMALWSEAVWTQPGAHFVLPSGEHADSFLRAGDLFSDPINLSRVADWVLASLGTGAVLLTDNYSILPLLQEVQIRRLAARGSLLPRYVVPSYGSNQEAFVDGVTQAAAEAARKGLPVLAVISAYSSGSYVRRLRQTLEEVAPGTTMLECILFSARGDRLGPELCHLRTESYAGLQNCRLCQNGLTPIAIDQLRFTTRIGTTVLTLPNAQMIEEQSLTIADLDLENAFAVHVDRPDRHKHLSIYVNTSALLRSEVFRAHATIGWSRCLHNFSPDLIIVPEHEGTAALVGWLVSKGITDPVVLNLEGPPPESAATRIVSAQRIVLCDDAVITGRSIIAALEAVQRTKAASAAEPFAVRGFVLLARPATPDIWKGVRSRFFVDNQHRLFAAWELYLPDGGIPGQPACPWCDELRLLVRTLRSVPMIDRAYIERRVELLQVRDGLRSRLFLGSEVDSEGDPGAAGTRTTPGSYLGSVSDVAAFVSMAAMVQRMRNEWAARPERLSQRYALPLDLMLQRFTDPVIVASLFRAVAIHELGDVVVTRELEASRVRMGHPQQHPVFAAEALLAVAQRKLPHTTADEALVAALGSLPGSVGSALIEFFHRLLGLP